LLDVKDVVVRYDTATILDGASITVEKGELVGWSARTAPARPLSSAPSPV